MKKFKVEPYETIFKKLSKLIPGLTELNQGEYRKSVSSGFMDLHLDVLEKSKDQIKIALSHNFEMNGDLIADPDMEIRVYTLKDWPMAEALTFQDQFGYRVVYRDGLVFPKAKRELNSFLKQWLTNCLNQGHFLRKGEN